MFFVIQVLSRLELVWKVERVRGGGGRCLLVVLAPVSIVILVVLVLGCGLCSFI